MYRTVETFHIGVQFVVADKQRFLSLTFIAEAAHAQTGRVRKVKTVVIKFGQRVFPALGEAFACRRRCTEQIDQQPGESVKVSDQVQIA